MINSPRLKDYKPVSNATASISQRIMDASDHKEKPGNPALDGFYNSAVAH